MTPLEIALLATAVASLGLTAKATYEQNEAQKDAARMQQASARIENMHKARRAVAARRLQQAEMIQATETMGARTSSAMTGAVGSLSSQTASEIGRANTKLASDIGVNNILIRGAERSAKFNTWAGVFNAAGSVLASPRVSNELFPTGTAVGTPATLQEQQQSFARLNTPAWIR